jgi:hypothetical protein
VVGTSAVLGDGAGGGAVVDVVGEATVETGVKGFEEPISIKAS